MSFLDNLLQNFREMGDDPDRPDAPGPGPEADVAVPVAVAIQPATNSPVIPEFIDPVSDEYRELANAAGWDVAGITETARSNYNRQTAQLRVKQAKMRFERFLAEEGICVYPQEDVQKYLNKTAEKLSDQEYQARKMESRYHGYSEKQVRAWLKVRWVWFPLAGLDTAGRLWDLDLHTAPKSWVERLGVRYYALPIPAPVLMTIAKIRERFPEATFHVSDFEIIPPDPFLMVRYEDNEYIIERWDEPEFRMS